MYYQLRRTMKLKSVEPKAWSFCRQISEYLKELTPEVNPQVFTTKFGERGLVTWTADFEDLNSLDAWIKRIINDEGYQNILKDGPSDAFDVNTWRDEVLHTL